MSIASIFGYMLLFALAVGFIGVGIQGLRPKGIPFSRRTRLTGGLGKAVGALCVLIGLAVAVGGAYDAIEKQAARAAAKKGSPQPNPQVGANPVPDQILDKKKPKDALPRLAGAGGIYWDVHEKWSQQFARFGWLFIEDKEPLDSLPFLSFQERTAGENGRLPAFSAMWIKDRFKDLPEPNVPFGLYMHIVGDGDPVLADIARFQKLKGLVCTFAKNVTPQGMKKLATLPLLEWLSLSSVSAVDGDFSALSECKQMGFLYLVSANVSDASLKDITHLERLRALHLYATPISDAGLKHISTMAQLEDLSLGKTKITDAGLSSLKGLTNLKSLSLHSAEVSDQGLKNLPALDQLEVLSLALTKVTDKGLKELARLPHLKKLSLVATKVSDEGLRELADLKNLEELHLGFTSETDDGVAKLKRVLPKLKVDR
jgi:hypothetical protein